MRFQRQIVARVLLVSVLGLTAQTLSAQSLPRLFDEGDAVELARSPASSERAGPRVLRTRVARLRLRQLEDAAEAGRAGATAPVLELNPFADTAFRAVFEREQTDALGHRTWVGRVDGDADSTVTLTWRGDTVVGGIQTRDALYRVSGTMNAVVVEQVDPGSFGTELEPVSLAGSGVELRAGADPVPPSAGEVVDVLVYFTTAAKNAQGGLSAIQAVIATGVADANTAYARSGLSVSLRLAGTAELSGYVESSDMTDDLYYIRSSATVNAGRDSVGADLVSLVVASATSGACGIGFLGPAPNAVHSVTSRTCIVGNYTFAHELGHNFGSHHAPEDGAGGAWKTYAYGYKNLAAGFRTVMAYAPGTRILNFSNPNVSYTGQATGTPTQNNALSLSQSFPIVQAFKTGTTTIPGPPLHVVASAAGSVLGLSWSPPATGTASTYWVQAGTSSGAVDVFEGEVGPVTSASAAVPDGTYFLRVYAQNPAGFSPASTEVSVVVNASGVTAPGPPRSLVGGVSGSVVQVSWAAPATGGPVANYLAQVGTASGRADVFNGPVGLATAASGTLGPGTYYVRVYAQNAAGLSGASNELTLAVGPACTVPSAPVLSASLMANTVTASWSTPTGGPLAGYTVQAGTAPGASNLFNGFVGLTNMVSAPLPSGDYFVRVVANAGCGNAASNEVRVTIP